MVAVMELASAVRYSFLGLSLDAGSWAEWFSGIMSGLAVMVALSGYWLASAQRAKEMRTARRQAADRVLVKLLTIVNSIHTINKHLQSQSNDAQLHGPEGSETWRMVQPMIGFGDEENVQFEAAEAGIFIEAKQPEYLMDLLLMGRRHSALISSMREYTLRRDALTKLTPAPVAFNGLVGTTELTQDEYRRIKPYALQVEQLIRTIIQHCDEDLKMALSVAERFGPIMKGILDDQAYISLSVPREHVPE